MELAMKHYCKTSIIVSTQATDSASSASLSRRRFISLFTASATSLALQACGGGAGAATEIAPPATTPPATMQPPTTIVPPTTTSPSMTFITVPDLTFVQGVPSSVSAAQWIAGADPAAVTLSLNSASLPAGVTYNSVKKTFDYDGTGAPAAAGGFVLTAMGS
jgi:ABC-type oligopeptide transport system substrate-binding subunit